MKKYEIGGQTIVCQEVREKGINDELSKLKMKEEIISKFIIEPYFITDHKYLNSIY